MAWHKENAFTVEESSQIYDTSQHRHSSRAAGCGIWLVSMIMSLQQTPYNTNQISMQHRRHLSANHTLFWVGYNIHVYCIVYVTNCTSAFGQAYANIRAHFGLNCCCYDYEHNLVFFDFLRLWINFQNAKKQSCRYTKQTILLVIQAQRIVSLRKGGISLPLTIGLGLMTFQEVKQYTGNSATFLLW